MTMFKFRLQRLLDLRTAHERAKSVEMIQAEAICEARRSILANVEAARDTGRAGLLPATGGDGTVGQLRNIAFVVEQLDRQVEAAATAMNAAEDAAAAVRQDLSEAHVQRRVLDRLRDRQATGWRDAEAQADRQTMDSIALARFSQRTTSPDAPVRDRNAGPGTE